MSKVLIISAHPLSAPESISLQLLEHFLKGYSESHPSDEIETLNLYDEPIDFLRAKDFASFNDDDTIPAKNPIAEYSRKFASYDTYLLVAPMWNFLFPAILKAYIDYIVTAEITFHYTSNGPEGLLKNKGKRAIYITATGGIGYFDGPLSAINYGYPYLKSVFGFMGIDIMTYLVAEGTAQAEYFEKKDEDLIRAYETGKNF